MDARKTSALFGADLHLEFQHVLAVVGILGEPVKDLNFSYFTAGLGGGQ